MTWQTNDGERFEASSPLEVVEALNNLSLSRESDLWSWMVNTADRIHKMRGTVVSVDSHEAFVKDLIAIGFIKETK